MRKVARAVIASVGQGNSWKKLTDPTAGRGNTAFPKDPSDQARLGVRFDYDGVIKIDDTDYHKFQMQANAGDEVPSAIKRWRNAKGGTHAVMADLFVKKDGTKGDVEAALEEVFDKVKSV